MWTDAVVTQKTTVFDTGKTRTLAALAAVAAAVLLPQALHMLGEAAGVGTALGQMFLPMHLPILLLGLLAGPAAGLAAGAASPVLSFALSGMPTVAVLPLMVAELAGYGMSAGLLARAKMPVLGKLLLAQLCGRVARAAAALAAASGVESQAVAASSVWSGLVAGLPGLAAQWALIPLILFLIRRREEKGRA